MLVESVLAFREGATNADDVHAQFVQRSKSAAERYHWVISGVSGEAAFLAPGWPAEGSPASGFRLLPSPGCGGRVASAGKLP